MGITPLSFTGISQFSNDFQTILNRAVSIASLPLKALQNQQADLLQKKQLAGNLNSAVSDLASAVEALGNLGQTQALVGTSSDSAKVMVNSTTADVPAAYSISVQKLATAAGETSLSGYADAQKTPVSATGTLQLVAGPRGAAQTYSITLADGKNNLVGLRDAINAKQAGVTASILTAGSTNYLSITANSMGAMDLQLIDDPGEGHANTQLLTGTNQGSDARFSVNGAAVQQTGNTVNSVVAGVAFTLQGVTIHPDGTDSPVLITLAPDPGKLASALGDLASRYNAVKRQVDAQMGPNAGLLLGDSTVRGVQSAMRALVNYNGSGIIKSLSDLGIELSKTGEMSFNRQTFDRLSSASLAGAFSFLGSTASGFGALSATLSGISDPVTGLFRIQQDQYDAADARISNQIAALTNRINNMQTSLNARLQSADALLAQLASQQNTLTASIQSLNFTSFGKQTQNQGY